MNQGHESRVIVVTGGSRGIGRAVVCGALAEGANVVFCARELSPAVNAILDEANSRGKKKALAVRADISREEDVDALFDETVNAFGRVDAVVNNAGINRDQLLVSFPASLWDQLIATNLTGSFLVARRAIKEYLRQGTGGRIVTLGSVAANGLAASAGYAASKGGLAGLTQAIADEYGPLGILAYLVLAGYVETDMTQNLGEGVKRLMAEATPQKRYAAADEIASLILFLISSRTSIANGEAIYAAGGLVDPPPLMNVSKV